MPRMRIPLPIIIIFLAIGLFRFAANIPNTPLAFTGDDLSQFAQNGDGFDGTVQGENGEIVQFSTGPTGIQMPKDFPQDVPVYPGAILFAATSAANSHLYTFNTSVGVDLVGAYYAQQLPTDGWTLTHRQLDPFQASFQGQKGNRTLNVSVSSEGERTLIALRLTKAEP